ncbi:MAG: DUF4230 domain-containing protein [Draconibacterium sp.]
MAGLFGKATSLILQIIVVVAAVLVFSWFDPLNILAPTKLKLKDTPIQVESIKEIGQLITAEYYGEVISSLKEVVGEQQFTEMQEFNYIVDDFHSEFKTTIADFVEEEKEINNNKDKIYEEFVKFSPELTSDPLYNSYLYYINEKIKNRNYKRNELNKELSLNEKKTLIKKLYLNRGNWRDKLNETETDEFKNTKTEVIQRKAKKEYRNSRLVLIGRGWVKAGFDFGTFNERNFKYDENRKQVHFIGLKPQIISATINPWFIPEEGVEGFEFLIAERGARLKPEYTKMVKQRCLDKLQQQAMEKQILKRSQDNAETFLKSFFSLLMDDEIKGVHFHNDYLDYTLDVILADSVIRNEELLTIDSSLVYYYKTSKDKNRREKIAEIIDSLSTKKISIYGESVHFNSMSSTLFGIVRDRMIDSTDIVLMNTKKELQKLDTIWFSKIFSDKYFITSRDSLSPAEKDKLNLEFKEKIENDNQQFCTDFSRLMKAIEITKDSAQISTNNLSTTLRGTNYNIQLTK